MKWLLAGAVVLGLTSCTQPAKSQEITITPPSSETPTPRPRPDFERRDRDRYRERLLEEQQAQEERARDWDRRHCHEAGPVRVCEGRNPYRR
jgi:hypothetical protein